jgi:hypothetical protein
MTREIIISLCIGLALPAAGQVDPDCEPVIFQKLDSVVNYVRVGQTDTYTPVDVFMYEVDEVELIPVVERLSLPSRNRVNKQVYFYGDDELKSSYILQVWNGSEYINSSRTDYFYDEDGFPERELFSSYSGGSWEPYQQHWYNYDEEMTVLTYLRQMMYSPAVWTDFSYKNYIYDDQGRLIERNEQRISDNVIFWVEIFTYNDLDRTASRVRQTLKYFPETRTYGLVNLSRQIYTYDRYNELSGYLTETWTDNEWVLTGKSVYHRSFLTDKIIPVCYNGVTMLVSVRIAIRLFSRGALPGSCECLFPEGYPEGSKGNNGRPGDGVLKVYPNPASYEITVDLPEGQAVPSDISIYSHGGSLVKRTIAGSRSETVDISTLKPGSYYLIVTADGKSLMTSFVKNH